MLRLILVRHGETLWNREHRVQGGASDTDLGERGREQAVHIAKALRGEKIDAIYSSPLKRTYETARAVARHHAVEIVLEPRLRELHTGELEGVLVETLRKSLFQYMVEKEEGGGFLRLPGGESLTDLNQRVSPAVEDIVRRHTEGVVVIVSHYFVLSTAICSLMQMPLGHMGKLRLEPGGTSVLHIQNGRTCLVSFNVPVS
ncbi:MAG: glmM [Dehalococcoidia bacterium]|nr:glmM [Dehalococcoidia bacterium]